MDTGIATFAESRPTRALFAGVRTPFLDIPCQILDQQGLCTTVGNS
jgi:hypothetical protein